MVDQLDAGPKGQPKSERHSLSYAEFQKHLHIAIQNLTYVTPHA